MTSAANIHEKMSAAASRKATRSRFQEYSLEGTLLASTATLIGIGMLMIYSASSALSMDQFLPDQFTKHFFAVLVGVGMGFVVMKLPMRFWEKSSIALWSIAVLCLGITLFAGTSVNGATRWLTLPGIGFRFQPGEIAKFATLLVVAHVLAQQKSAH